MFYKIADGHPLPHNPFGAIISPRPIGWISTRGSDDTENLAPYSFFNAIAYEPPQVMFASTKTKADRGDTKDTVANIRETGVFCVNIVATSSKDQMNVTSGAYDKEQDEFTLAGLERAECGAIACSRVARAPAALECKLTQIIDLPGEANKLVLGEVLAIHLRDDCLVDGRFDVTRYQPLARLGYKDYTQVTSVFELARPGE